MEGVDFLSPNFASEEEDAPPVPLQLFVKPVADPAGAFDADRLKQIVAGLHREVYQNEPGDDLHDRTLVPGVLPRLRPAKLAGLPVKVVNSPVVIGGGGLIGTNLVKRLRERGHEVLAASRSSGIDAVTGAGLPAALAGADVVVDVANSPSFEDAAVLAFFEASSRNLLAAEKVAGVGHHVALSVVGADRLPDSGYLRAKVAQEELIRSGGIPYTIVRATQFFEFVGTHRRVGRRRQHRSPAARPDAARGGRRCRRRTGRHRCSRQNEKFEDQSSKGGRPFLNFDL